MTEPDLEPLEDEQPDEAEPETSDVDEPDGPDTPTPEPAPDQPPVEAVGSEEEIKRMRTSLQLLQRHVAKRLGEILGDAVTEWEECEICSFWDTPGWRHKGPLPQEVEDVLRIAMGEHALGQLAADEYSRACEKCKGEGFVATGSRVQGQASLPCLRCGGMGWVPIGDERRNPNIHGPNGPQPAIAQPGGTPPLAAVPAPSEPPEVAALRAQGYMVFPNPATAAAP